jgi:hypothetical protein
MRVRFLDRGPERALAAGVAPVRPGVHVGEVSPAVDREGEIAGGAKRKLQDGKQDRRDDHGDA